MIDLFESKRGFTLIELLVVISIISLLSTVVMSSLNSARKKSQEAAIKSDLQSIKTQAELSYSKTGDYSLVASEIAPFLAHINANGGNANFRSSNESPINEGYKRYAVSVKLNSDIYKNWSVSSESSSIVNWDIVDQSGIMKNFLDAKNSCESIGKRLPTIEELKSSRETHNPSNDGFMWAAYGSNNLVNGNPAYVLAIEIYSGEVTARPIADLRHVRCVY